MTDGRRRGMVIAMLVLLWLLRTVLRVDNGDGVAGVGEEMMTGSRPWCQLIVSFRRLLARRRGVGRATEPCRNW